jgi:N utilization substance protein B
LNLTEFPDLNGQDVEVEVIEHPDAATERSVARRVALQILYEVDAAHHKMGEVIASRLQEQPVARKVEKYVRRLVQGVVENRGRLDAHIAKFAVEFPLDQVAIIDRNILRMAVYEVAAPSPPPISVIIAEAIELANLFGAEGSTRFVNGVLGAMVSGGDEDIRQLLQPKDGE